MQINKKFVESLNKQRYLEYVKQFPILKDEKQRRYTTFILTLMTVIFFGIFAINPTITTILELKKTLSDTAYVEQQLKQKIVNMSLLQQKYANLGSDLDMILSAIPTKPNNALLLAQIQAIAHETNVKLVVLQASEVELAAALEKSSQHGSYVFTLQASGTYTQMIDFLKELSYFERIISYDILEISRDKDNGSALILTVKGKTYFQK